MLTFPVKGGRDLSSPPIRGRVRDGVRVHRTDTVSKVITSQERRNDQF